MTSTTRSVTAPLFSTFLGPTTDYAMCHRSLHQHALLSRILGNYQKTIDNCHKSGIIISKVSLEKQYEVQEILL